MSLTVVTSDLESRLVEVIFSLTLKFTINLDYQFDNKYTLPSVLIACTDLFGGPPNNSKNNSNYIKIKTSDSGEIITPC